MGAPRISIAQADRVAAMMRPEDRKAMGIRLPEERAAKMAKQAERDLQRDCEGYLRLRGVEFLHLSHRAREKPGWPDLTFAVQGQACAVELKTVDGKASPEQDECLARLQVNGWEVAVLRTLADFIAFVKKVENKVCQRQRLALDCATCRAKCSAQTETTT